ncbi:hypothetical protein CKO23_09960 [Thiocystis violacea]|nr:hypothetical protein [Thiocystis violacea]
MAISGLLLAGCAGAPTSSYSSNPAPGVAPLPANLGNLPQTTLPGASRSEVKSLAMGAARSKGWSIAGSGVDRLIAQRAYDASMAPAYGAGSPIPPGSTLEVTSFFLEQGGGVNVATKAEVVAPAMGGRPAARMDYTDAYRDMLSQSLDSLQASWSHNRGRIAQANPPAGGWGDPWAGTPYARPAKTEAPSNPSTDVARSAPDFADAEPDDQPAPSDFERSAPSPTRTEAPRVVERPAPSPSTASSPAYSRPIPEPRRRPATAAPVVDATSVLSTQNRNRSAESPETPLPRRDNMMTLPDSQSRPTSSLTSAASAEQYARQRGCQVSGSGSQLIESRQDGEVHKVPCEGSDSFLVKCQNGTCQGLL